MKQHLLALATLSWISVALGSNKEPCPPLVTSKKLQAAITGKSLMGHCKTFEDLAYATPGRNRHTGSKGHNDTVAYIAKTLKGLGDYWDVELQPWNASIQTFGDASFATGGAGVAVGVMENSPSGTFNNTELVLVSNFGCEASDYPAELQGKIALISRGTCTFSMKSARSGLAGAVGAIVYNNVDGALSGTLGAGEEIGPHIPTVGMSKEDGLTLVDKIGAGETVTGDLMVETIIERVFTNNVIATSKFGDEKNTLFLGAHSDSVFDGPGINDNGSGSAALLTLAQALKNFDVRSRVRLGWWSGEEHGLLGSEYYVATASAEELMKIRLYLNFDMIASPNYVLAVYDGSGGAFNVTGPPGSAEAQKLFEGWFADQGLASVPTEFNGRSDYGPFLDAGVPCGGLFTGAEEIKTEEEAKLFGGTAGLALDENYHQAGDNYSNLNEKAFEINGKAMAHAVATYGRSFKDFPERVEATAEKKKLLKLLRRRGGHVHGKRKKRDEKRKGVSMSCGGHGDAI